MRIAIVGMGYVGLSLGVFLSTSNQVIMVDIDALKIEKLNSHVNPIDDNLITKYLKEKKLNILATNDHLYAYKEADMIIVALPTDYDKRIKSFNLVKFDTEIKRIIDFIKDSKKDISIIIKSTLPIGHTHELITKNNYGNIIYNPEFLRENTALYDMLNPSRIIIGTDFINDSFSNQIEQYSQMLAKGIEKKNCQIIYCSTKEAEAIKLFSNTYLAMRVAFFNELDTISRELDLNTMKVIQGVCADDRIGNYYNNPSFGYGGYCLPKDTKQLIYDSRNINIPLISAINESNFIRKNYVASKIMKLLATYENPILGVYRLSMKYGSSNYKESAIIDILKILQKMKIEMIVFEPTFKGKMIEENVFVETDLQSFKKNSTLIIANRLEQNLKDVLEKVFTCDIFSTN